MADDIKILRPLILPGMYLSFHGVADMFLLGLFFFPQYFGIRLGSFDLTVLRIFEILLLFFIFVKEDKRNMFTGLIVDCKQGVFLLLFIIFIMIADSKNTSVMSSMYWITNVGVVFYLVLYLIIYEYGPEIFVKKIKKIISLVCMISPFQVILKFSPFELLDFLDKSTGGSRFGSIRITGNWGVSNGYAMMLVMLLPIICYNFKEKKIDFWENKWTVILLFLNVILTGARLTVATFALTILLGFFFQSTRAKRNILASIFFIFPVVVMAVFLFSDNSIVESLLRTVMSAVDEIFKTSYATNFGADSRILASSTNYRRTLLMVAQNIESFNPFHGKGSYFELDLEYQGFFLNSIDNFYIELYIKYAITGLVTFILLGISFMMLAIRECINNCLKIAIIISIICYYTSLFYLSHLQTFPIMICIFALTYSIEFYKKRGMVL